MAHHEEVADLMAKNGRLQGALINARSLLRSFGGNLTKYSKAEAVAGHIDMTMWTVQIEIERALTDAS